MSTMASSSWLPLLSGAFDTFKYQHYTAGAECKILSVSQLPGQSDASRDHRAIEVALASPQKHFTTAIFIVPSLQPEMALSSYKPQWFPEDGCYYVLDRPKASSTTFPIGAVTHALTSNYKKLVGIQETTSEPTQVEPMSSLTISSPNKIQDILHLDMNGDDTGKDPDVINHLDLSLSGNNDRTLEQFCSGTTVGPFPTHQEWHATKARYTAHRSSDACWPETTDVVLSDWVLNFIDPSQRFELFLKRHTRSAPFPQEKVPAAAHREYAAPNEVQEVLALPVLEETHVKEPHHLNFLGIPIFCQSFTPPEVSLWVTRSPNIQKHHFFGDDEERRRIRKSVVVAEATRCVDPHCYRGDMNELNCGGSKLLDKVKGQVTTGYWSHGTWMQSSSGHTHYELAEDNLHHFFDWQRHGSAGAAILPYRHVINKGDTGLTINDDGRVHQLTRPGFVSRPSRLCQSASASFDSSEARIEASASQRPSTDLAMTTISLPPRPTELYVSPTGIDWSSLSDEDEDEEVSKKDYEKGSENGSKQGSKEDSEVFSMPGSWMGSLPGDWDVEEDQNSPPSAVPTLVDSDEASGSQSIRSEDNEESSLPIEPVTGFLPIEGTITVESTEEPILLSASKEHEGTSDGETEASFALQRFLSEAPLTRESQEPWSQVVQASSVSMLIKEVQLYPQSSRATSTSQALIRYPTYENLLRESIIQATHATTSQSESIIPSNMTYTVLKSQHLGSMLEMGITTRGIPCKVTPSVDPVLTTGHVSRHKPITMFPFAKVIEETVDRTTRIHEPSRKEQRLITFPGYESCVKPPVPIMPDPYEEHKATQGHASNKIYPALLPKMLSKLKLTFVQSSVLSAAVEHLVNLSAKQVLTYGSAAACVGYLAVRWLRR